MSDEAKRPLEEAEAARKAMNSQEELEALSEHRFRMRHDWDNLVEDLISEGQEKGAFDNLKGKGKPLNLKKKLYGQEQDLAHQLLKKHKMVPPWIMDRNRLLQQIDELRREVLQTWQQHEREHRLVPARRDRLALSWYDACQEWQTQIVDLNKQIENFNLKRPYDNVELFKLDLERELKRAGARRTLS